MGYFNWLDKYLLMPCLVCIVYVIGISVLLLDFGNEISNPIKSLSQQNASKEVLPINLIGFTIEEYTYLRIIIYMNNIVVGLTSF